MLTIQPTHTEHVHIRHTDWGLTWAFQFPEIISIGAKVIKHWTTIQPRWQETTDDGGWHYEWKPDEAYVDKETPRVGQDSDGRPVYDIITGLGLQSWITVEANAVCMTLALTNLTSDTQKMVMCDGGCLRPLETNEAFWGDDYVTRSYVGSGGHMVNMPDLHRTVPVLCAYWSDPAGYERPVEKKCESFWGRSRDTIDSPAILGVESRDGSQAVVIGYEASEGALAGPCCLHSRPEFGDIGPDSTVTRKGYILFGDNVDHLAEQLRNRIEQCSDER